MEILAVTKEDPLWQRVIAYAAGCSWRAGRELARQMGGNCFLPWERVFAALENNEICGFCTLKAHDELPEDAPYSPFIGFVYVEEAKRGQRLSRKLLLAAEQYALQLGKQKVYIMSGEKGLYEKYGYRKLGDMETIYHTVDQLFVKEIG